MILLLGRSVQELRTRRRHRMGIIRCIRLLTKVGPPLVNACSIVQFLTVSGKTLNKKQHVSNVVR